MRSPCCRTRYAPSEGMAGSSCTLAAILFFGQGQCARIHLWGAKVPRENLARVREGEGRPAGGVFLQ